MKYINRELKGTKGYINRQRGFELIKTLLLFAMALGIFFMGLLTLHTKKSLWSVFAVLALLPACKSLVGFIMFARFSSIKDEEYARYEDVCSGVERIYENILTTSDRSYYVPVICSIGKNVIGYSPSSYRCDDKLRDHLMNVIKNAGYDVTVKIFDDERAFTARISSARTNLAPDDKKDAAVLAAIRAVSL